MFEQQPNHIWLPAKKRGLPFITTLIRFCSIIQQQSDNFSMPIQSGGCQSRAAQTSLIAVGVNLCAVSKK